MSKNISIKEGNQNRNFSPSKLRTALQGGGSCLWVPKDGTRLKTISIRKPGTYQAWVEDVYGYSKATVSGLLKESEIKTISKEITENNTYRSEDEGYYGYDVVSVNVPGGGGTAPPSYDPGSSVVGTYPDGDEPVTVSVDDEGNLIKAGLADHILLDTPPDKLTYHDGERITLAGAVVRGYLKNGVPYKNASYQDSILPLYQYIDTGGDEIPGGIVFPTPLRAKYEGEGGSGAYIDDPTGIPEYVINNMPYTFSTGLENITQLDYVWSGGNDGYYGGETDGAPPLKNIVCSSPVYVMAIEFQNMSHGNEMAYYIFAASLEPFSYTYCRHNRYGVYKSDVTSDRSELNGNEFYYSIIQSKSNYGHGVVIETNLTFQELSPYNNALPIYSYISYIVLFGIKQAGSTQTITLTWPREGDRKHLKTSFEITVTP